MTQQPVYALKKKVEKPDLLTFFDKFTALAYRAFGNQGRSFAKNVPSLRDDILKSNLRITPEGLISVAILSTIIASVVAISIVIVGLLLQVLLLSLAIVVVPIVFLLMLNAPKISQSSRSYALENEFPFVIGFMEVLAGGGVSPIAALKRISGMSKIFPAASKEAKRILVDIEVFGMDPISALEKAASYNPNKPFTEFLYGYTTVLKTGGDVVNYVNTKMKETFENRSSKIRRTSETIGTLAEAYVTVTALLGISLFTLYQVEAVLAHTGGGIQNILLFSFLVVPLLSVMFIWVLDGLQTKQPFVDLRPYKAFVISAPIAVAIFLIPLPMKEYLHASVALIASVLVPSVIATRTSRERRGLERRLPDFIRDVAEGRKVGLPPEGAIEQLGSKDYGRLSKLIEKMGSQISWGLAISKVISSFVSEVNSWITKVIGTLMGEVVDAGGGTVKSFSEMADFTRKVNDMESDRRAALRPYIFVIYMAGLMIVMTTFLMVLFLAQPATTNPAVAALTAVPSGTIDVLLLAAIFQSWIAGFVAGKMGEGSIADGFKHSLMLVALSLGTIVVGSLFLPVPL